MMENIIKLEEELRVAMLNSDVEKLDELIADSLVFTLPNGLTAGKQMDLDAHKSGIQKMTELENIEQKIQFFGNFAVVLAKMHIEGTYADNSITGDYVYTRVWVNLNNRWQIVAGHVSQILP